LPVLAVTTTAAHYLITVGFPPLAQFLSRYGRQEPVLYLDGRRTAAVVLRLTGRGDLNILAAELSELPDIRTASTGDQRLDE